MLIEVSGELYEPEIEAIVWGDGSEGHIATLPPIAIHRAHRSDRMPKVVDHGEWHSSEPFFYSFKHGRGVDSKQLPIVWEVFSLDQGRAAL